LAIALAFVLSVSAFALGMTTGVLVNRMGKMAAAMRESQPSPQDMAVMRILSSQITMVGRTTAILLLFAVGAMASARWI